MQTRRSCLARVTFALAAFMASAAVAAAQTPTMSVAVTAVQTSSADIARYTGSVVRPTFPTRPFELRLDRWSTWVDRNAVVGAFKAAKNPAEFSDALERMPIIGGFRTISGQANPVRYAEEVIAADGTRKLIVLSDRQVDYWEGGNAPNVVMDGYTLMEVHFTDGAGTGVVSHGLTKVMIDPNSGTLAIADFDAKPAQLIGVTRLEQNATFDLDDVVVTMIEATKPMKH